MSLQAADFACNEIFHAVAASRDDLVVSAPPGSGKTHLAEGCAALNVLHLNKTTLIACHTNEQADDITRRIATRFPKMEVARQTRSGYVAPTDLSLLPNVIIDKDAHAPTIITTAAKLMEVQFPPQADLLIVDEAYQIRHCDFLLIRDLAPRSMQIGDIGQIDPIVPIDIQHWAEDPMGPHVSAPKAVLARNEAHHFKLPISRRLCTDTTDILCPAFYHGLSFTGIATPKMRRVSIPLPGTTVADKVLDKAVSQGSICSVTLPQRYMAVTDEELIDLMITMIKRLFARKAVVKDLNKERLLQPEDIGIVAARREQVASVQQALADLSGRILTETAHRFQGLERKVMFTLHPLSGIMHPSSFYLDPGLMCVSLSRHRVLCILMTRRGIEDTLAGYVPEDDRYLGQLDDPTYSGYDAHGKVWSSLKRDNRLISA